MGGDATRWDVRNGSGLWSTALSKTSGLTSSCVSAQSAGLELTYYLVYCGFDGLIFDRYGGDATCWDVKAILHTYHSIGRVLNLPVNELVFDRLPCNYSVSGKTKVMSVAT